MLKDRLKKARQAKGLSQAKIAKTVGMSQPSYQALESGATERSSFLPEIALALDVDANWLLTGVEAKKPLASGAGLIQTNDVVEDWDSKTPLDDDEVEIPFYKDMHIACGVGYNNEHSYQERRKLRFSRLTLRNLGVQKESAVAATAVGNSMSPVINEGATVFIDRGETNIKDGKIYAISHGGLEKIKYLYRLPLGGVRIVSANSAEYPEEHLTAEDIIQQEFFVCGRIFSMSTIF